MQCKDRPRRDFLKTSSARIAAAALVSPLKAISHSAQVGEDPFIAVALIETGDHPVAREKMSMAEKTAEFRPNLTIITNALVTRLILGGRGDDLIATGVEYHDTAGSMHIAHGAREVVLNAGAIGSSPPD